MRAHNLSMNSSVQNKISYLGMSDVWRLDDQADTDYNTAIEEFYTATFIPKPADLTSLNIKIEKGNVQGYTQLSVSAYFAKTYSIWSHDNNNCDAMITGDRQIRIHMWAMVQKG